MTINALGDYVCSTVKTAQVSPSPVKVPARRTLKVGDVVSNTFGYHRIVNVRWPMMPSSRRPDTLCVYICVKSDGFGRRTGGVRHVYALEKPTLHRRAEDVEIHYITEKPDWLLSYDDYTKSA